MNSNDSPFFIIYGKENCPHCVRAKNIAVKNSLSYEYLSLGEDYTKEDLVARCDLYGFMARTVPQIFCRQEDGTVVYIGGADDFQGLVQRGC